MKELPTILSLSGGKTSSYLFAEYDQDESVFALVTNEDPDCAHRDSGIWKRAQEKAGKEMIGTTEHEMTIKAVLDLEQQVGKEITWLVGDTFEQTIRNHSMALPNQTMRFCTQDMKLRVIFEYIYIKYGFVNMQIGFRYDEMERKDRATTSS